MFMSSEERVCNPIVLSVLSNVAISMGLSSFKTSGETVKPRVITIINTEIIIKWTQQQHHKS